MNGWSTSITSRVGPMAITCFSASTAMREDRANRVSRSCVTITTVKPSSRCSDWIRATKLSDRSGSRPAVGSSRNSSFGSSARARARATRLIMPPDKSDGIFSACSGPSPTMFIFNNTASCTSASGSTRNSRIGWATLSNTVRAEYRAPCWNSMPQWLRNCCNWSELALLISSPKTLTQPRAGCSRPSIWRSSTVLPVPEPPTMERISPRSISRFKSWCTTVRPNLVHRLVISTTGALPCRLNWPSLPVPQAISVSSAISSPLH